MITASIRLQNLQRRIYAKAKAEPSWRFWGLYVHVCKLETLREAYAAAKANHGAPGIDGVTFEAIEAGGVEAFLQQLRDDLVSSTDSAPAVSADGDSEGEWPQGQTPVDSRDPRPRGPRSTQVPLGAHLRGRLPTGLVWVPAEAVSASRGGPDGGSHRAG
jgi:hypothetical protein